MINRVILIVMDSVGVGYLPDARRFNDDRSHTLLHIYQQTARLHIPNLCALGLGKIAAIGCKPQKIIGCYGKMAEKSSGKDTTTGHWEIAGLVLNFAFPTYPHGFPPEIVETFEKKLTKRFWETIPDPEPKLLKSSLKNISNPAGRLFIPRQTRSFKLQPMKILFLWTDCTITVELPEAF